MHIPQSLYCEVPFSVKSDSFVNGTLELVLDKMGIHIYAYRVLLFVLLIQNKQCCHYGNMQVLRNKTYRYRKDLP